MAVPASNHSAAGTGASSISSTMLRGLKDRDSTAWSRFVRVLGPVVYQQCRRSGLQPSDAENVMQEVFLSVATKVETFQRTKPDDTFRGWLRTITRNKIRNYLKRWKKHPDGAGGTDAKMQFQEQPVPEFLDSEEPSDPDSDALIVRRVIESIRDDFEDKTWQCFWRMAVEGHSAAEISANLGMKPDAVRQAKRRVSKRLQQELDGLV